MRVPLTISNLLHQKLRSLIAVSGVAFAVLLIFMQLGFLASAETAATVFLEHLDGDLVMISANYLDINRPNSFPRSRLFQAVAVPGVERATSVYTASTLWRIVQSDDPDDAQGMQGRRRSIMIVGFNPADHVFRLPGLDASRAALSVPGHVLIDTSTRNYFGKRGPGVHTDLGTSAVEVVGTFTIGTGYGADGMLLMSEQTYSRVLGGLPLDRVNLGVLKLQGGADPEQVAEAVRRLLPADEVRVVTLAELEHHERDFWVNETSLGKIFWTGVVVALAVGTVFTYQVISTDITNRYREYATLKALGYSDPTLIGLVTRQAVLYGLLGYGPKGLALALTLYAWVGERAALPMTMTLSRCGAVLIMGLAMCSLSAFLAVGKVRSADPADLF